MSFRQQVAHDLLRIDLTTEARAVFLSDPRLKDKALLLDLTIVNPCVSTNLENAARQPGKHLADAVKRKKNNYWGSFPATYSLLPLAMSTCGEVGPGVHALIKELAIRREENSSEVHSEESRYLVEGTEIARPRRRFPSSYSRHCPSTRDITSVDRGWRLHAATAAVCKTLHLQRKIVQIGTSLRGERGEPRTGLGRGGQEEPS